MVDKEDKYRQGQIQEFTGRAIVRQAQKNKKKGYEVPFSTHTEPKLDVDVMNQAMEDQGQIEKKKKPSGGRFFGTYDNKTVDSGKYKP